jgi:hypothetical protein
MIKLLQDSALSFLDLFGNDLNVVEVVSVKKVCKVKDENVVKDLLRCHSANVAISGSRRGAHCPVVYHEQLDPKRFFDEFWLGTHCYQPYKIAERSALLVNRVVDSVKDGTQV